MSIAFYQTIFLGGGKHLVADDAAGGSVIFELGLNFSNIPRKLIPETNVM